MSARGAQDATGAADAAGARDVPGTAGSAGAPDGAEAGGAGPGGTEAGGAERTEPRKRSSRFPALTRDTARPEGGGRAAGGDAPAPYRQWPLLAVCGGALAGLLVTLLEFRTGTLLIGASLLGGAVLRWAVAEVGMLAVRSRFTDLVTYGVLGTAITLLAMMAQPNPWLNIPFLNDIVHFTVR